MELFIQIRNGQPFEHPIFGDNFRQAFPDVDINNLPPEFARFERVQAPTLDVYEKNQRVQYECDEYGIYHDVWYCDRMTVEEIKVKQDKVKAQWYANSNAPKSWAFDENTCSFQPPISYPSTGKHYIWDEPSVSWVEFNSEG